MTSKTEAKLLDKFRIDFVFILAAEYKQLVETAARLDEENAALREAIGVAADTLDNAINEINSKVIIVEAGKEQRSAVELIAKGLDAFLGDVKRVKNGIDKLLAKKEEKPNDPKQN